mmetsp:Transcript_30311/g.78395  ORF Transcript_30311/g.78395 Transcript_30311/m.78395 type:complete len:105 (-) Transcript_30311:1461-1775(-)
MARKAALAPAPASIKHRQASKARCSSRSRPAASVAPAALCSSSSRGVWQACLASVRPAAVCPLGLAWAEGCPPVPWVRAGCQVGPEAQESLEDQAVLEAGCHLE